MSCDTKSNKHEILRHLLFKCDQFVANKTWIILVIETITIKKWLIKFSLTDNSRSKLDNCKYFYVKWKNWMQSFQIVTTPGKK